MERARDPVLTLSSCSSAAQETREMFRAPREIPCARGSVILPLTVSLSKTTTIRSASRLPLEGSTPRTFTE